MTCRPLASFGLVPILLSLVSVSARAQPVARVDVLGDAGVSAGGGVADGSRGLPPGGPSWLAGVSVMSRPKSLGRSWHFSMGAGLEREPVVGMARVPHGVAPAYFDVVRGSGTLWFVHTSGPFDVAIAGRYAETWMGDNQRATRAANDNGAWTFMFEATAHLRMYAPRDTNAPVGVRRLMPVVDLFGGVKHDRRLHRFGDLDPFDDPTGRVIGGAFVSAWRSRGDDGRPRITVGAGVDFETALRTGVRLPSAGRAFIRTQVDLRRLASR